MLTTTHLIGFGAAIATRRTGSSLLDRTAGTNFGNYTADGGLGACFDGTTIQNNGGAAFGSATPPYVGKNWGSALYCYDTAIFYPAADRGFCDGSPTSIDALSVYPLLRAPGGAPFYDTLSDAVRAGTLHITEVSAAGSVPELRVVNDGKRPVLIIDGEELIGAKQNRIVNLTVLVPESTTIPLPVTCVESGRWRRFRGSRPRSHAAASSSDAARTGRRKRRTCRRTWSS